jgi:CubicO group peptidase (beta-lactamase class C family)
MSKHPDIRALLDAYNGMVPGCAVAIIRDGSLLTAETLGYADLEKGELVTLNTNFRLCSVSKQFTATAILLLVERKLLTLDDKLTKFFPSFPSYGREITISELLTHASGLIDYEDLMSKNAEYQIHDEGVLELLMRQDHDYFKPGTAYRYSNGGYCLLRIIVEKVSGKDFAEFMRDEVFMPLGMTQTFVDKEGITTIPRRAYGYSRDGATWVRTDQGSTSATIGDGGIYSSIADLQKWDQSLYGDSVLSATTIREMFSRHILTDEDEKGVYYGLGFFLKEHRGMEVEYHGGDSIGFRTGIYRVPEENTTVIFLSNRNEGEGSVMCERIFDAVS